LSSMANRLRRLANSNDRIVARVHLDYVFLFGNRRLDDDESRDGMDTKCERPARPDCSDK